MDLIILVIAIGLIIFFYKKLRNVIYFLGILEIFFRLTHTIADALRIDAFNEFVDGVIPASILSILDKYSSGLLYNVFVWLLIIVFILFESYLIKGFFKKK